MAGGNIIESGTRALCDFYCETFDQVVAVIDGPSKGSTTEYLLSSAANRLHLSEALRDIEHPSRYVYPSPGEI